MSMKLKNFFSILLSLALVLGLMPGMSLTAYAATETYTKLMNDKTVVKFNNYDWYIIADNSTAVDDGTVTLLAADTSFGLSKFHDSSNAYSGSTVKSKLDALTAEDGAFASVKDAIADTDLSDVDVYGAKLYLLSTSEAGPYANFDFTGEELGGWWLRSPGNSGNCAAFVVGCNGTVFDEGNYVYNEYGVRPALKLNLSSVIFSSVNLSGGANATASGGSIIQNYFDVGTTRSSMTTVTYTANSGFEFPETSDYYTTTNGIKVERTSDTVVTVSGTPTANTTITVPDAVEKTTATYTNLIPTSSDTDLTSKQVTFNGYKWYIIADNSTAVDAGTVTLLAADTSFGTSKFHDSSNAYSSSTVKGVLDALTEGNGPFASVKDAIADTDLTDVNVTGAKLYLLSTSEAEPYKNFYFSGAVSGSWWLRSRGMEENRAAYVDADLGIVDADGRLVGLQFGVRPALKLNLSSVIFSSESKEFSLRPSHTHSFTYSASGMTITATCTADGCDLPVVDTKHVATLTISATGGTYDGTTAYGATVTDPNGIQGDAKVQYQKKTDGSYGTATETAPKDAGDYMASITLGGATASVEYTIAQADTTAPYASLKNTTTVITFDGKSWYLIDYDANTVTLLAKECVVESQYDSRGIFFKYSQSTVKSVVDNWYNSNITADAQTAVSDDAMFLLTKEAARAITNAEVRKDATATGGWWLCSQGYGDGGAAYVVGENGDVAASGYYVLYTLGVRPALKLNLSSVIFSSESNTFSLKPAATVTKAPTAKSLTYTGQAQGLVNAGEAENGTMQYALGTKNAATGTYSASIPTATDAGTYYVWYKAVGDDAHADSVAKCITVTISEALKIEFKANGGTGTMDDQKVTKNEVTKLKTHTFTREDHSFKDWNTREDGSGTSYSENAEVTLNENLILYAQWSKVEKHNHNFEKVEAVEAGCETDGNKSYYRCTDENCDEWYEDASLSVRITDKSSVILKATGHKWDDGEITKEATYDEEGVKTYTCLNDPSHTKEETIPRLSSSSSSDSDSDSDSGDSGSSSSSNDSDSSSSDSGSSGGSGSKNNSVSKQVLGVKRNVKSNVPSNHQVETGLPASDVGGKWIYNSDSDTWSYMKSDGTLAKKEWLSLDYNGLRYWYYFNDDGNMHTNWFDYKGERFYLMPKKDGWLGRMATGWKNIDNKWYYFDIVPGSSQGRLYRSTVTPDGHAVGADGAWNGVGETPVGQE